MRIFQWIRDWAGTCELSCGLIVLFEQAPACRTGMLMKLDAVVKSQALKEARAHGISMAASDVVVIDTVNAKSGWLEAARKGSYDLIIDATEQLNAADFEKLGLPAVSFPQSIFGG